ncbi:MAG: pseudouridine synthase [Bacteroidales bacterium]
MRKFQNKGSRFSDEKRGDRKSYSRSGDRNDRGNRESGRDRFSREGQSDRQNRYSGERKTEGSSAKRFEGRGENSGFRSDRNSDRPVRRFSSDRDSSSGERRSYGSDRSGRPSGERRSYGSDRSGRPSGERRSYGSDRSGRPSGERRSYGSDRSGRPSGERRSYGSDRSDRPSGERRSYGSDRSSRPSGERRSYGSDRSGGRSFRGRNERSFGERSFSRRSGQFSDSRKSDFKAEKIGREGMRLNKYLANAGVCSRREADELIQAGTVKVNGETVTTLGTRVMEGDKVNYGGQTLNPEAPQYLLLNKPKGFITTVDDPFERRTVMSLVENACKERIYPVGRLDRHTTGLLLFTNDGDLAKKLTHPSNNVSKIYHVVLNKPVLRRDMESIVNGVTLDDGFICVDKASYVTDVDSKKEIGVELHSGRNRIVRRIFEHLGYKVEKLDRVCFAGLTKKDIPRGKFRFLKPKEVTFLKHMKN